MAINKFIKDYTSLYVSTNNESIIRNYADKIMETGIKKKTPTMWPVQSLRNASTSLLQMTGYSNISLKK